MSTTYDDTWLHQIKQNKSLNAGHPLQHWSWNCQQLETALLRFIDNLLVDSWYSCRLYIWHWTWESIYRLRLCIAEMPFLSATLATFRPRSIPQIGIINWLHAIPRNHIGDKWTMNHGIQWLPCVSEKMPFSSCIPNSQKFLRNDLESSYLNILNPSSWIRE